MTRFSAISCEAADGKTAAMLCAIEAGVSPIDLDIATLLLLSLLLFDKD